MLSGKGDCAHVGAGGGTVVSSGGSSLASGKCSGKGLHNVGLYMFTHALSRQYPSSSCKDTFVVRERALMV